MAATLEQQLEQQQQREQQLQQQQRQRQRIQELEISIGELEIQVAKKIFNAELKGQAAAHSVTFDPDARMARPDNLMVLKPATKEVKNALRLNPLDAQTRLFGLGNSKYISDMENYFMSELENGRPIGELQNIYYGVNREPFVLTSPSPLSPLPPTSLTPSPSLSSSSLYIPLSPLSSSSSSSPPSPQPQSSPPIYSSPPLLYASPSPTPTPPSSSLYTLSSSSSSPPSPQQLQARQLELEQQELSVEKPERFDYSKVSGLKTEDLRKPLESRLKILSDYRDKLYPNQIPPSTSTRSPQASSSGQIIIRGFGWTTQVM